MMTIPTSLDVKWRSKHLRRKYRNFVSFEKISF